MFSASFQKLGINFLIEVEVKIPKEQSLVQTLRHRPREVGWALFKLLFLGCF